MLGACRTGRRCAGRRQQAKATRRIPHSRSLLVFAESLDCTRSRGEGQRRACIDDPGLSSHQLVDMDEIEGGTGKIDFF